MGCGCEGGMCPRCKGGKLLVLGLLVLININWLKWDWWTFVGTVLILIGIAKLVKPYCPHCEMCDMPMKKKR